MCLLLPSKTGKKKKRTQEKPKKEKQHGKDELLAGAQVVFYQSGGTVEWGLWLVRRAGAAGEQGQRDAP